MNFETLLTPASVKILSGASSKKRLFQEMSAILEAEHGQRSADVMAALLAREALGTTGVGHGVALPHARLETLRGVVGCAVVLDRPVDYDAVDRRPIDIAFGLFAPLDAGVAHLKALALVSRTLRNTALCNKLRSNHDAGVIYDLLVGQQQAQVA